MKGMIGEEALEKGLAYQDSPLKLLIRTGHYPRYVVGLYLTRLEFSPLLNSILPRLNCAHIIWNTPQKRNATKVSTRYSSILSGFTSTAGRSTVSRAQLQCVPTAPGYFNGAINNVAKFVRVVERQRSDV